MENEKNLIKTIILDIEGKEISLTSEQATKLCNALMDLLGKGRDKEYILYPYYPPYGWYCSQPKTTWNDDIVRANSAALT